MTTTTTGEDLLMHTAAKVAAVSVTELFNEDDNRARDFRCEAVDIVLDYSKHRLDRESRAALLTHADACVSGGCLRRPHPGRDGQCHRAAGSPAQPVAGTRAGELPDLWQEVQGVIEALRAAVEQVHDGIRRGFSGDTFTDVVNIGIGGSDFGPRMVCRALRSPDDRLRTHFAANVDPQDLDEILAPLDPARTLFIICSKSFTTEETLTNALRARAWLRRAGATQEAIAEHTLAVTTNIAAAEEFGIRAVDCFPDLGLGWGPLLPVVRGGPGHCIAGRMVII